MHRLRAWIAAHPMLVDGVWALLGVAPLAASSGGVPDSRLGSAWAAMAWLVGFFVLPLVWRRTRPDAAIAVVAVGCLTQLWLWDTVLPVDLSALLMLYAVGAYGRREWRHWWLGAALVGAVLGSWDWSLRDGHGVGNPVVYGITNWVFSAALSVAFYVPGVLARQRRDLLASLQDRARSLERERDSSMRLAAQEERARIAREMHDIVAHSLSVIVVQSDGAGYAVQHGDPDAAREVAARTLATIGDTARTALAETRRLVGVLRESGEEVSYAPQATLDQVDELVAKVNEAGMPATLTVVGDPAGHAPLGATEGMAVYRVVQEALTNAMKHAGAGACVTVEIRHLPGRVELAVRDTGSGPGPGPGEGPGSRDGHGNGLVGMRERMAAVGGELVARERLGGGFEVLASLPLGAATAALGQGDS
nr:histidine kinase [Arsenicicoccus dermatophilus]